MALPAHIRRKLVEQFSDDKLIGLLTITNPENPDPVYISSDPTVVIEKRDDYDVMGTKSRGHDFLFVFFGALVPDNNKQAPPSTVLVLDNIDRAVSKAVRSYNLPSYVTIEIVLRSDPDTPIDYYPAMKTVRASGDIGQVSLELAYDTLLDDNLVSERMTKERCRSIFP